MTPSRPLLVLASASPRRRDLLCSAGLKPEILPAAVDETPNANESARVLTLRLARSKAETVATQKRGTFVMGADTVVAVGRRILGTPRDREQFKSFLKLLSGRRHAVTTTVVVIAPEKKVYTRTVVTRVTWKRMTDAEMAWLVSGTEWQDKAGGYALQGAAGAFIKSINGSVSNVMGLPLYETLSLLQGAGFPLHR